MNKSMNISKLLLIGSLAIGPSIAFAQSTVSSDIHIGSGEKSKKSVSSVSGDITIGNAAKILASVSSVSGDIRIGAKAEVEAIESVSGDIAIGKGATSGSIESVSGDLKLYSRSRVNGYIELVSGDLNSDSGSKIYEAVSTVSGDIELDDTLLRGDVETVSGDISLFNGARIAGDIIISRQSHPLNGFMGQLKIIIDMKSVVEGDIRVKEADSNVIVYLTNGGKVQGKIINAEVRKD